LAGTGPFLAPGYELSFASGAVLDGQHNLLADSVSLQQCQVGDVHATDITNDGCVMGTSAAFPAMPAAPSAPAAVPSLDDLHVDDGDTFVVPVDAALGHVVVGRWATLKLAGGVVHVAGLEMGEDSKLEAQSPVELRVAGRFRSGHLCKIRPKTGIGLTAQDFTIWVLGTNGGAGTPDAQPFAAHFDEDNDVTALVNAPAGTLYLGEGADAIGALFGRDVDVGVNAYVWFEDGFAAGAQCGDCDDQDPCTLDACELGACTHTSVPAGTACDNATVCDGHETCDAAGTCVAGTPPQVDDGEPCTVDSCDPVAGVQHTPVADGTSCADSDVCNGGETCSAGACVAGTPPQVDDGEPCTVDSCDPVAGVQHIAAADGTSCSDSNVCNGEELCSNGACAAGTPLPVDDG
ncbi:MAG: hypothetical protein AB1716_25770, partial [Planctomycetota bacterium]